MNSRDQVVLVDANDDVVGQAEKLLAHQQGLLHRAFSVFIFDAAGQLLLQRRARGKYHSGGLWSNTCCGHPMPGENVDDAAARRLGEEMGISCKLDRVGGVTYRLDVGNGLTEHECDHLFVGRAERIGRHDTSEVEASRWISPGELSATIARTPEIFSAWLSPTLRAVLKSGTAAV